jgi:DNA-binding transcriptional regulator YiaG
MRNPKMTPKQFRDGLKQAGLTQAAFAEWAGFTAMGVNNWAKGRRWVPQNVAILVNLLAKYPEIAEMARNQTIS